ncbi:unnamed protein product [Ostreobium quekettii]|uniref:Actin n=1 Tax=Ostreobium quekettii TaxID=121088 RepID=A0A8S1IP15_9CHLO|nr:unnamed protein product [Ostreobium quekettii]|eukprot:evm.model.scf_538.1 EVM.evm.TU.scf_538.1   scf_538:63082-64950(+)
MANPSVKDSQEEERKLFSKEEMKSINCQGDTIVCDAGEWMIRAGFAGATEPVVAFPDILGRLRAVFGPAGRNDLFIGDEAYRMSGILSLRQPIENNSVKSFDDLETIWSYLFNGKLGIHPMEHCMLVTEPPLCPKRTRERMTQVFIETYNVPAVFMANKAVLPLYAHGMTTGVVLDSGEGRSWAVPVYEGYALPHAVRSSWVSGHELTDRFMALLAMRGLPFGDKGDRKAVRRIKEEICYVSREFDFDVLSRTTEAEVVHELPDGQIIGVGAERFIAPEALFNPSIVGMNDAGVHDLVAEAISASDHDVQRMLADNVVIAGGSTMFPNFVERLEGELHGALPKGMAPTVVSKGPRDWLTWLGGSTLAHLSSFPAMCVSREEYAEAGPAVMNRRSF